jgi:outer membrane immunogenic protein
MKLRLVAFVASAAALAAPALAADAVRVAPPAPPVVEQPFDWHGFYVGVHGGGGWGHEDATFKYNECSPICAHDFDTTGPYVGAHAGVNLTHSSKVLLGLEADINWSGIDGVLNEYSEFLKSYLTTTYDLDYFGTLRGRLGLINGDWLFYVTGGWAYGQTTRTNSSPAGGTASASVSGWTVGGGLEKAIAKSWTLSAEYKYIDFKPVFINYPGGNVGDVNVDINVHTFQIGISKHF